MSLQIRQKNIGGNVAYVDIRGKQVVQTDIQNKADVRIATRNQENNYHIPSCNLLS